MDCRLTPRGAGKCDDGPDPRVVAREELGELDLNAAGVTTVIWASGYSFDFGMVKLPVTDDTGYPIAARGVTGYPGLYFVGLPWLSRRGSTFIWGVWHDARHVADHIATQLKYLDYRKG